MTDAGKEERWSAAKEQIRNGNLHNEMIMSCEEDEQEGFILYSPIQIYVNEEADSNVEGECHQFNAFTDAPLKIYEGQAADSLIKIPATLVVASISDSAVRQSDRSLGMESGNEKSCCNSSRGDTNSLAVDSFDEDYDIASCSTAKKLKTKAAKSTRKTKCSTKKKQNFLPTPSSAAPKETFECVVCGRNYKYKGNLTKHLKYQCGKEPIFSCTFCNYRTAWKDTFKTHLVHVHNMTELQFAALGFDPQFQCSLCNYRTKLKNFLRRHLTYIHGIGPVDFSTHGVGYTFQCDLCPFSCGQNTVFQEHMATEHEKNSASLLLVHKRAR